MTKYATLIFISGLTFLLMVITAQLPIGEAPMLVGNAILSNAANDTGASNIVTAVVLAYRGLDTLGELSILFTAASVVSLILPLSSNHFAQSTQTKNAASGFIVHHAIDLLFPLFLVVGFCIIFHGHLTPGGGFQGGVILAIAFFMVLLVRPKDKLLDHHSISIVESASGITFIIIGLSALFSGKSFLQPLFINNEQFGNLWSAGTLPLLYLAVGLKVGAELAGLLSTLLWEQQDQDE